MLSGSRDPLVCLIVTFTWVLHWRTHVYVLFPVCMTACGFFPGCHGGEGREEGKEEGQVEECLERKEENMCVGESTKSTVHV